MKVKKVNYEPLIKLIDETKILYLLKKYKHLKKA